MQDREKELTVKNRMQAARKGDFWIGKNLPPHRFHSPYSHYKCQRLKNHLRFVICIEEEKDNERLIKKSEREKKTDMMIAVCGRTACMINKFVDKKAALDMQSLKS